MGERESRTRRQHLFALPGNPTRASCFGLPQRNLASAYNDSTPQAAVNVLKTFLEETTSIEKLYPVLEPMCIYFMKKVHGYNGPYMCPGIINSYGPVVSNASLQSAAKLM